MNTHDKYVQICVITYIHAKAAHLYIDTKSVLGTHTRTAYIRTYILCIKCLVKLPRKTRNNRTNQVGLSFLF